MTAWLDLISPGAAGATVTLLSAAAKGAGIIAVGALVTLFARRGSAASRHLVWTLALAGAVALPALRALLPDWRVPLIPAAAPVSTANAAAKGGDVVVLLGPNPVAAIATDTNASTVLIRPAPSAGPIPGARRAVAAAEWGAPMSAHASTKVPSPRPTEPVGVTEAALQLNRAVVDAAAMHPLVLLWLVGALLVVLPVVAGLARVHWLARRARPVEDGVWAALAPRLIAESGIRRPIRVLETYEGAMPMTWGIIHPVLLLPAGAERWTEWQRRDVLRHELAHVRRFDCLTQLVAQLACALYWFNPLAWIAARQMRVERERACDDYVLSSGAKASEYAEYLLQVAHSMRPAPVTAFAALAMARRSQLSDRLLAVLDDTRSRARVSVRLAVPAVLTALAIVAPLAAFTPAPRAAASDSREDDPTIVTSSRASSVRSFARRPVLDGADAPASMAPFAPAALEAREALLPSVPPLAVQQVVRAAGALFQLAQCDPQKSGQRSHTNWSSSDRNSGMRTLKVRWSSGNCSFEVNSRGEVVFNADATDVTSISEGGYFEIEERDGDDSRRLVIRPRSGGALERTYYVNGERREFDGPARTWLAESFVALDRQTAFAVDQRLPKIYEQGGVAGVLQEISQLDSDYARRIYYTKLLQRATLTPAQVRQVVQQAGKEMSSDYELAELLIAVAKLEAFSNQSHDAFVEAARTIDSDYERRRVLSTLLKQDRLSTEVVKSLLEVASEMDSDYELAELLISVSKQYAVDERTRPIYIAALGSLSSDYEHRRVLTAIINGGGLTPAVSRTLLQDAARISSDYERTEFLISMVRKGALDASTRDAYFAAVKGINSDYEHRRALMPLLKEELLTKEMVRDILVAARNIRSDYECASLLTSLAAVYPMDGDLREAYLKTADTLDSEYEYGRAMVALRKRESK